MSKPKYSVILPNYLNPHDRFATYGGEKKAATELIDMCGKQGAFQGVEIIFGESITSINQKNKKGIKAALEKNGLQLAGVLADTYYSEFAKGSLGSADAKTRGKAIDLVKQAMDIAAELNCSYVGQWPGQDGWDYYFEMDYQKMYENWVSGMRELADYNPKINLGLEPKPYEPRAYSFIDNNTKVLLMARDIDRKNVGLTLDIGHSMYGHESLAEAVALAQKEHRLFHLHINDNYGDVDGDMPFGSVHLLSLVEFFYWLKKTDYQGWHSVDIFPYRTNPAETVLESQKWMQAIYNLVDRAGMDNLANLTKKSDGVAMLKFFRELLLEK